MFAFISVTSYSPSLPSLAEVLHLTTTGCPELSCPVKPGEGGVHGKGAAGEAGGVWTEPPQTNHSPLERQWKTI